MIAALAFQDHASGRVSVMLGIWTVAAIDPFPFPGSRYKAHWRVFLPGLDMRTPQPAVTFDAARAAVTDRVTQWLEGAAMVDAPGIRAVRS